MIRYLVSAILALATLVAILFALARVSGPGETLLIRKLELLVPSQAPPSPGEPGDPLDRL